VSYAEFHDHVRALADPFVLQVGACDGVAYDPVREVILEKNLAGLLIEPCRDLYLECKASYRHARNLRLYFANLAVAPEAGPLTLRRVPLQTARELPPWVVGLSTARQYNMLSRPIAEAHGVPAPVIARIADSIVTETVDAYPLRTVLVGYAVARVDVMVVDVEGMEWDVFRSFSLAKYLPAVILVEHTTMSRDDKAALHKHLCEHDYAVSDLGADWLAVRNSKG
jgi:hypothetical protein